MATWVVGDVQGCYRTLDKLARRLGWASGRDRIVFCGDLVNRGPRSADVLRWAREYGAEAVLGNHDMHLLARAEGLAPAKRRDTLDDVLGAKDRDELLGWLRARPLLWRAGAFAVVHAGLLPQWSADDAEALARETEVAVRGRFAELWATPTADAWDEGLRGLARARLVLAVMTRLRVCDADGRIDLSFDGAPADAPKKLRPWFEHYRAPETVVFGHWSALGLYVGDRAICLDTGCVWGGTLSAVCLDDRSLVQEPCVDRAM
ncbi:MAG TPA: symmetrical bis(5'-nucleosyl)-tetraphosphatase [Haliangiales bacterium]|nr:symmetrical bis(5'-nucleosyl)-tetraphosphatase [Haliangiales bacterium]